MQQERAKELFGELVYDTPLHSPGKRLLWVSVVWYRTYCIMMLEELLE